VAVTVHLSTETASMPLNWALYLPQAWVADPARCRRAGVPAQTRFRTKPELAMELIDQLLAWGLRPQPVLADAGYGNRTGFRAGLARRELQYVVGVESSTTVEARRRMHTPIVLQHRWLCSVLRGHFAYFGLPSNFDRINAFYQETRRLWYRALNRRSQRRLSWER
jgi:hypothetical protein